MKVPTLHAFAVKAMLCGTTSAFFLTLFNPVSAQEARTWVDSSGQFKIEATYDKVEDGKVFLKLTSGGLKQIPLSMLSSADQDHVKELLNPTVPDPSSSESPSSIESPDVTAPSLETEAPPADVEQPMAVPQAAPIAPVAAPVGTGATPAMGVEGETDSLPDAAVEPVNASTATDFKAADVKPLIFYQKRIGDLDIDLIEPLAEKDGFRANPKYLFKVDQADIALLPREFQGAAMLLLNEPTAPRKAIPALEFLKVRWPENRQPTLLKLLINCASSDHKFNREDALKILTDRDPDQSFPYIFARVDDTSFTIRSLAYQLLRKIGDRRAIAPLAKRFASDDVDRISSLLRSFGSDSEDAVSKFLNDPNPDIRLKACNLIGKIGTEKSLPALEQMQQREKTMMLLAQTRSSINKIKRRSQSQSQ